MSCKSTYPHENSNYALGKLSSTELVNLKQFLATNSSLSIRDTIIIKYDYNNDNCWWRLDQQDDQYIQEIIDNGKAYVVKNTENRNSVSYLHFREPGDNTNKNVSRNESIIIDASLILKTLLFQAKKSCGNSAIILPNGDFIIVKSDSHNTALEYDKKKISQIVTKLKNS